jgi:hypothetical protein
VRYAKRNGREYDDVKKLIMVLEAIVGLTPFVVTMFKIYNVNVNNNLSRMIMIA